MRITFASILLLLSQISFCQKLDNTTQPNESNIFYHAIFQIIEEYHDHLKDKVVILEGEQVGNVMTGFGSINIINSESQVVFWTEKGKLHKNYKHLIGKELVRLRIRRLFVENGKIRFAIALVQSKYSSRSKRVTGLWQDGIWMFTYKQNNGSFSLGEIDKGIIL